MKNFFLGPNKVAVLRGGCIREVAVLKLPVLENHWSGLGSTKALLVLEMIIESHCIRTMPCLEQHV